jgi:hypothetical protein
MVRSVEKLKAKLHGAWGRSQHLNILVGEKHGVRSSFFTNNKGSSKPKLAEPKNVNRNQANLKLWGRSHHLNICVTVGTSLQKCNLFLKGDRLWAMCSWWWALVTY